MFPQGWAPLPQGLYGSTAPLPAQPPHLYGLSDPQQAAFVFSRAGQSSERELTSFLPDDGSHTAALIGNQNNARYFAHASMGGPQPANSGLTLSSIIGHLPTQPPPPPLAQGGVLTHHSGSPNVVLMQSVPQQSLPPVSQSSSSPPFSSPQSTTASSLLNTASNGHSSTGMMTNVVMQPAQFHSASTTSSMHSTQQPPPYSGAGGTQTPGYSVQTLYSGTPNPYAGTPHHFGTPLAFQRKQSGGGKKQKKTKKATPVQHVKDREDSSDKAAKGGRPFDEEPIVLDSTKKQLIVNFVSQAVSDEEFAQIFSQFGELSASRIIYDKHTHRSKGYGFVYFKNGVDAIGAIKCLNGMEVHQKFLKVGYASPQRPTPPSSPSGRQLHDGPTPDSLQEDDDDDDDDIEASDNTEDEADDNDDSGETTPLTTAAE